MIKDYATRPVLLLIYLCPFIIAVAFALDIYIPVIPDMRQLLNTTQQAVQLTLTLFLATNGIGQLLFGPISDQIGRRPMLIIASAIFTLGNIFCALLPNITLLIIARIITALGACGMLVTANASIRDLYHGEMCARMYSLTMTIISVSPIFAPLIGGHLALWLGVSAVFWFLALLGFIGMMVSTFLLNESLAESRRTPLNYQIFHYYLSMLKNSVFIRYALLAGCGISIFFSFFSVSPVIIIELFKVPITHFGYYFAILGVVVAAGGILNSKWLNHFSIRSSIFFALILILSGGVIMLLWPSSLLGFIIPFIPIGFGGVFLISSSTAGAMEPFGHLAGYAAASIGFIQFFIASIAGSVLMTFTIRSTHYYAFFIIVTAVIAILLRFIAPLPSPNTGTQ